METKYSLASRITIPNGADLNDYLVPGSYASQGGSYTIANNPYNNIGAFGLDVEYCLGDSYYIKQTIKPYMSSLRFYVRYWSPNIWSHWSSFVQTSDLGYIDCKVSTIANNRVSIPGAPSTNLGYIPVIVGHDTTSSVLDNVFYDAGEWRMYSSFTQLAVVRFYKYPL